MGRSFELAAFLFLSFLKDLVVLSRFVRSVFMVGLFGGYVKEFF
jgi:hypothetical protein